MLEKGKTGRTMDVLEQITDLARRVCATHGLDLVDVELFRAGRRRMVRVYIGKAAGVSVDDCAKVSREVSAVLDAENWLGEDNYVIEVSSPGLDRPFKTLADWARNVGREVRVTCREKLDGKIQHQGKLIAADDAAVSLETPSGTVNIPMGQVALAKLEIKLS
jgi:ribosome maturation factor RimP